ncbi:MAG: transporter permease [Rhodospirillales bacterium]|nr:transporter permease [Rhodospirillales bacterium]
MKLALLVGAVALTLSSAVSAGEKTIKIGVLTDLSSFAATSMGPGSVAATEIAVSDFGGTVLGKKIEVISADMQSKPDLAVQLARTWYDTENVDLIVDVPASAAALTIQTMAIEKNKMFIATVAATTDLSGKGCTATSVHWGIDTNAMSRGLVNALAKDGAKTWFLILPDYALGKALGSAATAAVTAGGGKVLDTVYYPPNSQDYSQYVLRAQQSGADVIGAGNVGLDLSTLIKQASEFGVIPSSKQKLAAFVMNLSDVHAVGLPTMQGVYIVQDFYWDQNDATRAFAKKFLEKRKVMPNYTQAANYTGVLAYLNAIKDAGTDDPKAVVAKLKEKPQARFEDKATVRADGRVINTVDLYRIKSPAESKGAFDYLNLVGSLPGDQAFQQMADSECPLVKK